MSECEDVETCAFLKDIRNSMPVLAETVMEKFCNSGGMGCARKMVNSAMDRVTDKREITEEEQAFRKKVIDEGKAH